jgi:hypothetical protein
VGTVGATVVAVVIGTVSVVGGAVVGGAVVVGAAVDVGAEVGGACRVVVRTVVVVVDVPVA